MSYQVVTLAGTTDESGDATVEAGPVTGEVVYVEVDGGMLSDSANLVLTPLLQTGYRESAAVTVLSSSEADPTVITTDGAHGLVTGDHVIIAGDNSVPVLDGEYVVTVTDTDTFTIPVEVTTAGTAGTVTRFSASDEEAGEQIVNHADIGNTTINKLYPMTFGEDNAGVDLALATGAKTGRLFFVPGCNLRAVISGGGDTKTFRVKVFVR